MLWDSLHWQLPLDPQLRTSADGAEPLNLCASLRHSWSMPRGVRNAGKPTFPYQHLHGACERRSVGWLTLYNVSSAVARQFCRISIGLGVLMPSEVSTVADDQSVEELRRELVAAREQQAATAEILRVISGSPTNLQRVFAEIAAGATRLCDANDATIRQVERGSLRLVAHHGPIPATPIGSLTRGLVAGRAVLDRQTIQVADVPAEADEYPEGSDIARRLGFRTNLAVPLILTDDAIGVINLRRTEARPFTDRQIELLKTFANQAVIAIENARLFEAEQASKRELQELLEHQTATSEV